MNKTIMLDVNGERRMGHVHVDSTNAELVITIPYEDVDSALRHMQRILQENDRA